MFKVNQIDFPDYQYYLGCYAKRMVRLTFLEKKVSFSYGKLQLFRLNCNYWILKIGLFRRVEELSKSNQTWYGISLVYLESKTKRSFAIACLGKKLVFQTEICYLFKSLILKYSIFDRVKELSKWNQTWHVVSLVYLESKTKRNFAVAWLGKKLVFQTEICDIFKSLILKYSFFDRVKELSKSNQTWYGVSHVYIESETKTIFSIDCLGKKFVFSIGNIDLFAYSIFKNIEILSGQGVVQSEPNWYPRLPVLFRLLCKKNGPPNFPRKKFVFQSEILSYALVLFSKI